MAKSKPSFEKSLGRLEEIVTQLESPDLELDKSLELFEEGIKQARKCETELNQAEGKIEKLIEENGTFRKATLKT